MMIPAVITIKTPRNGKHNNVDDKANNKTEKL